MWQLGALAAEHRKACVLIHIDGYSEPIDEPDAADFNATFAPFARLAIVRVPPSATSDGLHLTASGSLLTLFASFNSTFIYQGF